MSQLVKLNSMFTVAFKSVITNPALGILPWRQLSTVVRPETNYTNEDDVKMSEKSRADDVRYEHSDYFGVHSLFTVKDMFDAKVHLGHKEVSLENNMKPFIFGSRLGHIIFDLDKTAFHLRQALNFAAHVAYNEGIILFASLNKPCTLMVENTVRECNEYGITRGWKQGTFSNSKQIMRRSTRLPDLCILLNTLDECEAPIHLIQEAAASLIPVIAIVDSNCNPNLITYPVPGNDDSPSSIAFFCKVFKEAILLGKNKKQKFEATNLTNMENQESDNKQQTKKTHKSDAHQ